MKQFWRWMNESALGAILFPIIFFGTLILGAILATNFESFPKMIGMVLFWGWLLVVFGSLVLGAIVKFFTEGF